MTVNKLPITKPRADPTKQNTSISDMKLPRAVLDLLELLGFSSLYPPQVKCIKAGLLDGEGVMVSAPTASGKTLMAMMAITSYLSRGPGKVIYLSPLRALAAEKFTEFKMLEKVPLGRKIRVNISTGDFDRPAGSLARGDILILTNERMDSIIRHLPKWMDQVGLIIADEIHLIGDQFRGPTLEMILTTMKMLQHKPQIVGLSATITNAPKLAKWLGVTLVRDNWRPVPLSEGVCTDYTITMKNGESHTIKKSSRGAAIEVGLESVADGGQVLVFASTRARAVSAAKKALTGVRKLLSDTEKKDLESASSKILENENTDMVKTLAGLVQNGVAFHHAGLNQSCRETVETEFRERRIKILASTPTLAAGVNLPARRVVLSGITRYDSNSGGSVPIPVMEYKQICGRAGRPQYDKTGEAILVYGGYSYTSEEVMERYIYGSPEPIKSGIIESESLQIHVLSRVVVAPGSDKTALREFFLGTLGGIQSRESKVVDMVDATLDFLESEGFIEEKQGYRPTRLGTKVSRLYIRPSTAVYFRTVINHMGKGGTTPGTASPRPAGTALHRHDLGFLYAITRCDEFIPWFGMRDGDRSMLDDLVWSNKQEFITHVDSFSCNRSFLGMHYWTDEQSETKISKDLNLESGDMHKIVESSDRLIYCLGQLVREFGRGDLIDELAMLRRRVKYGIKEELLDLATLKGVGRVRARNLYKRGLRTREQLASAKVEKISRVKGIGKVLAASIKSQMRDV